MFKKRSFFAAMLLMTSLVFTANAVESKVFAAENREHFVSTGDQLVAAVNASTDSDIIKLNNDITLYRSAIIKKSITIDLQGHKLSIKGNESLECGYKSYDHDEQYTEYHPGYYYYETKEVQHDGCWYDETSTVEHQGYWYTDQYGNQKWQPAWTETVKTKKWRDPWTETIKVQKWHDGWNETKTRPVYRYHDEIKISIKNGSVIHCNGEFGESKKNGVYSDVKDASGTEGQKPYSAISAISGQIYLSNLDVQAGNGGDGGDGAYTTFSWFFHTGGHGGNGGNGGDGGNVFYIAEGNVYIVRNSCHLFPGNGGKGGKGSAGNPKYWMFSSKKGKDGAAGKSGGISNRAIKIHYI